MDERTVMFEMLAKYAEGLNTTPIEVLRLFLRTGLYFGVVVGLLLTVFFCFLLDRFFVGIGRLFRWLWQRLRTPR